MKKRWIIGGQAEIDKVDTLSREFKISHVVAKVLLHRGICEKEAVRRFLWPKMLEIHAPELFCNIDKAVERIIRAIRQKDLITIYGDYDVDGVTGTALLMSCIKLLGGNADYYIPHRMDEGYGLNPDAIVSINDRGTKLLVTIDCGIQGHETIIKAKELGMDVIVTDHHEFSDELPDAYTVINPKDRNNHYPFPGITGVGVAFKIAWALCQHFSNGNNKVLPEHRSFLLDAMGLVALGTVADVAPMLDENRIMTKYGLESLSRTENLGIKALKEVSNLPDGEIITEDHIAFRLGPRINAMGRLEHSKISVELLTTKDKKRALELARMLDDENQRRRRLEQQILEESTKRIEGKGDAKRFQVLVLEGEGWHPGVIGIVASRLTELYYRPAIMIALDGDIGRASARSIAQFNLYSALESCSQYLITYGGHAMAAGFRIVRDQIEPFRSAIQKVAENTLREEDLLPSTNIDVEVRLSEVTSSLIKELEMLSPFGEKNPRPVLMSRDVKVAGMPSRCGNHGAHLSFWVEQDRVSLRAISFGNGELCDELKKRGVCSLIFHPKINTWGGRSSVELEVKEIRIDDTKITS